jgi:hypothetical protein
MTTERSYAKWVKGRHGRAQLACDGDVGKTV